MLFQTNARSATDVLSNYYAYGLGWTELLIAWPELTQVPWIYEEALIVESPGGAPRRLNAMQSTEIRRAITTMFYLYGAKAAKVLVENGGFYTVSVMISAIQQWLPDIKGDVRQPILDLLLSEMEARAYGPQLLQKVKTQLAHSFGVAETDVTDVLTTTA
jgi:hypothetical protein